MSKLIFLTQGQFAVVDDDDYERVNQFKWHAAKQQRNDDFYAVCRITKGSRKKTSMQNFITGAEMPLLTDHINHNTLDNRKVNLRVGTKRDNELNRKSRKNSSSKYLGVSKKKGGFEVNLCSNGINYYLGLFQDEKLAALTYNSAAKEIHGKFAYLNVID